MAYISVPSPGKWILDIFGKHIFRHFVQPFFLPPARGRGRGPSGRLRSVGMEILQNNEKHAKLVWDWDYGVIFNQHGDLIVIQQFAYFSISPLKDWPLSPL